MLITPTNLKEVETYADTLFNTLQCDDKNK